jgi:GNAT superfamily N-acetyltransferase
MTAIDITEELSGADLDAVRDLCRSFRDWLYERYPDERDLIDLYYDPKTFEQLLIDFPVIHARPDGAILLARLGGEPAGCVMLRKFDDGIAEMKRLFVSPDHRGHGVGVALGEASLRQARRAGYHSIWLETGPLHSEAQVLYKRIGFTLRDPYYDPGPEWRDKLIFMERELSDINA